MVRRPEAKQIAALLHSTAVMDRDDLVVAAPVPLNTSREQVNRESFIISFSVTRSYFLDNNAVRTSSTNPAPVSPALS